MLPPAGPATRFVGWLIDLVFTLGALLVVNAVLGFCGVFAGDAALEVSAVTPFAVPVLYGLVFERIWQGQTPGKRALRLRVVDVGGQRPSVRQMVIRNLLRAVDLLPWLYLVGGAACLLTRRTQRLGDLAVGTVVVRAEYPVTPNLPFLVNGKDNPLRDYPPLGARLRQRISAAEAGLALKTLLRRDALDPLPRDELFARLAECFHAAVPLPPELVKGLTKEQRVRLITEVLYFEMICPVAKL